MSEAKARTPVLLYLSCCWSMGGADEHSDKKIG